MSEIGPGGPGAPGGFLAVPPPSPEAEAMFADDIHQQGYVMNVTRLWAYQPDTYASLFATLHSVTGTHRLSVRQRGILVTACAAALGDAYCALSWGNKLAAVADPETAAAVLRGDDDALSTQDRALAGWARAVARDANATTEADVAQLRAAGFGDGEIFAITAYVALRIAFATVNDALAVLPDDQLRVSSPEPVRRAVPSGRC